MNIGKYMREIYLDNAATTRVDPDACELMERIMLRDYGNPSSLHMKGVNAEIYIKNAKSIFRELLKCDEKELIFTSGATESNNMAVIGGAYANCRAGKHIIMSQIEHPSVAACGKFLKEQGFDVSYIPVDDKGRVMPGELKKLIRPDTIMVSVMAVNNETGTIQPLEDIIKVVKGISEKIIIHVDGVQAFTKVRIYPKRMGIDMFSISGHKFHGPKGVGLLWVRDKVRIRPLILGGGQQKDMRSGTENVPAVAGMARAAEAAFSDFEEKTDRLYVLRDYFIHELEGLGGTHINGGRCRGTFALSEDPECCSAPHIVSVSFDDIRAEVLLHALEERGIYVSSGSACSSNHPAKSGVLSAMKVPKKHLDSTIRFSFSFDTEKEDIDICLNELRQVLPVLRRYTPGGRKHV